MVSAVRLTEPRSVSGDGTEYAPGKILIATGSHAWAPAIPGLAAAGFLGATDALSLPRLPQSLVIIGAGVIGLELGQLFAQLRRAGDDPRSPTWRGRGA